MGVPFGGQIRPVLLRPGAHPFSVELQHRELERIDQRDILFRSSALKGAVEKFVRDNGGNGDLVGLFSAQALADL